MTSYSGGVTEGGTGSVSTHLGWGLTVAGVGLGLDSIDTSAEYNVSMSEGGTSADTISAAIAAVISQGGVLSDNPAFAYAAGAVVHEVGKMTDTAITGVIYSVSIREMGRMASIARNALTVGLQEGGTLTDVATAAIAVYINERAQGSDVPIAGAIYNLYAQEGGLAFFAFSALAHLSISEGGVLTDAAVKQYLGAISVFETGYGQDVVTGSMRFTLTVAEGGVMDDELLLQMLWNGAINEGGVGAISYLSPSGNVTTWVMNTRTNAITEYNNWRFNSFANRGTKYLAADENGIYELNGDRDLTANVVADMAGGFVQFNRSKFAGLKGVYIGMRGEGEYFLKMVAGDKREYLYKFTTNPGQMTTKVRIGKGLRSRYFQWELISTGPDFDLDTLEFIPMVSDRRV